jgi:hypothetical protein
MQINNKHNNNPVIALCTAAVDPPSPVTPPSTAKSLYVPQAISMTTITTHPVSHALDPRNVAADLVEPITVVRCVSNQPGHKDLSTSVTSPSTATAVCHCQPNHQSTNHCAPTAINSQFSVDAQSHSHATSTLVDQYCNPFIVPILANSLVPCLIQTLTTLSDDILFPFKLCILLNALSMSPPVSLTQYHSNNRIQHVTPSSHLQSITIE